MTSSAYITINNRKNECVMDRKRCALQERINRTTTKI